MRALQWLTQTLWDAWQSFLPNSTQDTVLYAGYYTTLLEPGLRVVSFNTEFGSGYEALGNVHRPQL